MNEATDYAENAPYAAPEQCNELCICTRSKGGMNMAVISYIDAMTMAIREEMERDQ